MRSPLTVVVAAALATVTTLGATAFARPGDDHPDVPEDRTQPGDDISIEELRLPEVKPREIKRKPETSEARIPVPPVGSPAEAGRGEPSPAPEESAQPPEAVHDCRLVEGRRICDTFGETDEGPGTTEPR